ncbi:two-component system sensor histidine kinase DraK [Acidothermaceae bacterium B102]|nr:two-component system sensor histidine kinase DraK [Acidothermaceae bacterium B102]
MKARLLRSTLTIALVAVVTLGVPLLLLARHEVWTSARESLRQQATSVAAGVEDRLDERLPVGLQRYADAFHGRHIVVVGPQGARTTAGPTLSGSLLQAAVHVSGYTITVQAQRSTTVNRARAYSLLVVGLALLAVGTAVGLALWQSRRLVSPLSELVQRADAMGRGDFAPVPVVSGITEIDSVSHVLERSGRQIAAMLEQQRNFASDAAHQLRTPLTGIGLRLEELTRIGDGDVRQESEAALAQVERLDRVISALLARARGDAAAPTLIDLDELIRHEAALWSQALELDGRSLRLVLQGDVVVRARREHVAGVLSCLLDNALHHGSGRVTVTARTLKGDVYVEVADCGAGVPADLSPRVFDRRVTGGEGTGIGLSLARSLAETEGGELALVGGSTFRLTLPGIRRSSYDVHKAG